MIELTRLNGSIYFLNPDMIMTVEATPDTIITMTNGEKVMVKETTRQVVDRFVDFKRRVFSPDA